MRCKTCHYSLIGLTGPPFRCPECGRAFDPNDPGTFTTVAAIRTERRWSLSIGTAAIIIVGLHWFNKGFKPSPTPAWYDALSVVIVLAALAVVLWQLPGIHRLRHKKH